VNGIQIDKLPMAKLMLLAAGAGLLLIAFWGGLEHLAVRWVEREEYSHGFFIPLITVMFLWHRKDALIKSIGKPSMTGLLFITLAMILLLVGEFSALFILIHIGFILALMGLVLAYGGWSLLKVSFIPLAFLIFAIPMPYFIDAQLTWWLQLISSEIGTEILRLFGVSVYLEGNVIDLGVYKLQVVEACSGLNYLYPLLSLGFLAAYLFSAPLWQRVIIFLSTIPITVFMNSFRIAVIGVLVEIWGIEMAEGFLHFFEGWVIFIGCAILLLGEIWLFDRFGKKRALGDLLVVPEITAISKPGKASLSLSGNKAPITIAVLLIAVSTVSVLSIGDRTEERVARKDLTSFPLLVGEWRAREDFLSAIVENKLQVDDYLLADYFNQQKDWLNFYIAYYESQRKGVSPHSPRVCIPGGGWRITDLQQVIINEPGYAPFPVNRIVIELEGQRQLGYYWFEQRGRRIANEYWMKWFLLKDSLLMNRTDGALVRVMTDLNKGEELEDAEERVQGFVKLILPVMSEYIPGK